ncbi:MAG: murein hydrolase activator EnvC family protein [Pseudomonadota bacterium]
MPRLAAFCLLPALLLAAPGHAGDELEQVRKKIAQAQERLADIRGELSRGQSQLRDAEKRAARIAAELRTIRRKERELAASLGRLDAERAALDRQAAGQARALARDMRDAWQLGRSSPMRSWLSADDPQRAARLARYYEYVQRDRAKRLDAFRATKERLAAAREKIAAEQQRLAATRSELAEHEREADKARAERRSAVAQLAGELKSRRNTLERLRADEAALKRVLETARDAFRDIPPEAVGSPLRQRKGKLRWPAVGRIAAGYGSPLAEGKLTLNGIVIAAAEGSEVRAVHHGRVVYADWLRGYGLLSIVDHGDGFLTVYGYNQSLLRNVGDWVKEGEPIATVGTSGGRTTAGLYFELRAGGEPQDPARWLRR